MRNSKKRLVAFYNNVQTQCSSKYILQGSRALAVFILVIEAAVNKINALENNDSIINQQLT
jgi:hypothetical protein